MTANAYRADGKLKRFFAAIDMKSDASWRDKAINAAAFDRWDVAMRRRGDWFAGLTFWSPTNVPGSRVLLARHWPHLLCWSWSLWIGLETPERRRFCLIVNRRYRFAELGVFGPYLRLSWQDYGHMVASRLRGTPDAGPEIIWKHQLASAQPAGSA